MIVIKSIYSLILRGGGLLGGFLSVLCISRWLSPSEAGLFFNIVSFLIAFALFSRLGQDKSLIPEVIESKTDSKIIANALSISLYPFFVFSLAWFLIFDIKYIWMVFFLYLMIFNNIISSYFKAKFKSNFSILFENSFIYSILLILLLIHFFIREKNMNLDNVIYLYCMSIAIQSLLIFFYDKAWFIEVVREIKVIDIGDFFYILFKLKDFIIIAYLGHLLRFLPILVLMVYFDLEDLASYKVIEQISMSSGVIIVAVSSLYSPYYAKYKSNWSELKIYFIQSIRISIILGLFFVLFMLYIKDAYFLFSKFNYIKYGNIYFVFLIASFFNVISAPFYNVLIMIKKQKIALKALFFSISISLFFIFISIFYGSLFILSLSQTVFYFSILLFSIFYVLMECKKNYIE